MTPTPVRDIQLGPDSARYMHAGQGHPVARPFHLRVLLPAINGDDPVLWWACWYTSWVVAAGGLYLWGVTLGWQQGLAMVALCLALPGVWGPHVVRPVGVDLPAMALSVLAVGAFEWDPALWPLALVLVFIAASVKESAPVWAALWAWHPLFLLGLVVPAVVACVRRPEVDQFTAQPQLLAVHDHPIRTALLAHRGRWRDAWLMVAPWGATLAALYAPSWQTFAVLAVTYAQLLVATDTVRLLHTAAGPFMAYTAVQVIPVEWLPLAVVLHVWWWRKPELV